MPRLMAAVFVSPAPAFICVAALVCLSGCSAEAKKPEPPPPMSVLYVLPTADDVTEFEEFTGRTSATETIELRARVSGRLDQVNFEDGAKVNKGDLLFKLDDRPFVAEEQRTAAAIAQFEARIGRVSGQVRRAQELRGKNAISQEDFEAAQFDLDEAQASLAAARASHELASLNLQFTSVTAPLSGRIGRRLVDVGNLVAADQTALATILSLDQLHVYFDMDERSVLRLRRMADRGTMTSAMTSEVTVQIALADSDEFMLSGRVDFLDNQLDSATGTLRVRATVDNADGLLSPGMFVRVRYPIGGAEPSLLIPEESLASDQGRPFVYVVADREDKSFVEARPVELGPLMADRRVIRSGITASDRVVVTGLQRLRRNTEVRPKLRGLPAEEAGPASSSTGAKG